MGNMLRLSDFSSLTGQADQGLLMLRWGSAVLAVALIGYGLWLRRDQDNRRRYWPQVLGQLVDERFGGYGVRGGSSYDSVVTFRTLDGIEVTGTPRGGVHLGTPTVGRSVPVWYDPRDANLFEARIFIVDRAGSLLLVAAAVPVLLFLITFLR